MRTYRSLLRSNRDSSVVVSSEQHAFIVAYITRLKRIRIAQIFILVAFISIWEIGTRAGFIDAFVFSSPSRVIRCIYDMALDGSLFRHIGVTLAEAIISFSLVILLSLLIAILLWWNESVSKVVEPYLVILNSLPKSALAPVFIVWLGNNMKTIIIAAISVAVFGSIISIYTDFQEVEEDKIKLIRTLGGGKKDILFRVIIPSNIASIISVMKVNIGLSLVGVIIGEFLAAKEGLGYLIIYGTQVFKLDYVIMSIVILCVVAAVLYKVLGYFENKYKS